MSKELYDTRLKSKNNHKICYERSEEKLTVEFNCTQVAQSSNTLICQEDACPKRFYFPIENIEQKYRIKLTMGHIARIKEMLVIGA